MSNGFRQPAPGWRDPREPVRVELDFCDGCGARFRPTPLNAPGVCTRCALGSVYAVRYES